MPKYFHIKISNAFSQDWKIKDIITTPINVDNFFQNSIHRGLERITATRVNNQRYLDYASDLIRNSDIFKLPLSKDDHESNLATLEEFGSTFQDLSDKLLKCNLQYLKWIREDIFEKKRQSNFKNLPSRKRGLWLCEKDQVEFWWNEIGKSLSNKIYEVEINNVQKIHRADESHVRLSSFNISEFENNASNYWNGETNEKSKVEILFEGELKVIQSFKDINEWKKFYSL